MLIPLKTLMEQDMASAEEVISSFLCPRDRDIETFLKEKAIKFEATAKSRSYLLIDEALAQRGELQLLAYFSLAIGIVTVQAKWSGNFIKKLDGFSANFHGKRRTEFPCYLIGQLAKNAAFDVNEADGSLVMDYALAVIGQSNELVGGRIILVECRPVEKLIEFYEKHGFSAYNSQPDSDGMIQLMRLVY